MAKEENEVAMEILEQMVWSALFYNRRAETALRLTTIGEYSLSITETLNPIPFYCMTITSISDLRPLRQPIPLRQHLV